MLKFCRNQVLNSLIGSAVPTCSNAMTPETALLWSGSWREILPEVVWYNVDRNRPLGTWVSREILGNMFPAQILAISLLVRVSSDYVYISSRDPCGYDV